MDAVDVDDWGFGLPEEDGFHVLGDFFPVFFAVERGHFWDNRVLYFSLFCLL